jgi:apolipoprotein N-acyltransferase
MVIAWLRGRSTLPLWILAPPAWVSLEAVLPNIFPIYMAHAWSWQPLWIQAAEIGGVTMVSAIMVAINAGLYTLAQRWWATRVIDRPAAIFTASLLMVVPTYGAIRIAQIESRMEAAPKRRIGVVQGNMSIRQMADRRWRPEILRAQQRKSQELEAQGAQLVVWGETAYPNSGVFKRQSTHEPPEGDPWRVHQDFTVPVVVGAVTRDATRKAPYPWNTALLIDSDGQILAMYDKVYRLIFGEYIPLVDPMWYLSIVPSASHLEQGDGPSVMELGDDRLGPFICYEDILPRYVRQTALQRVHVFVNLTNDAWFGKTAEPAQHLGLAVFRTVEHRRPMVRAVNTGISAYVDPTGRVVTKTGVTDPDIEGPQPPDGFVAEVPMMDPARQTIYGLTGESWNGLCVVSILFMGWRGRPRDAA